MSIPESDANRRQHIRVPGPFDGSRVGLIETPLRIFDLSSGGCFVIATHEQRQGVKFTMQIQLPIEGVITVKAETLYSRGEFGFAVRFLDVDDETAGCLARVIERLHGTPDQ